MPVWDLTKRIFFGRSRDPLDPQVFHQLSLVAFLAWVGLGADGLSSSAYGPEEAFLALGTHTHLAVFLAGATALTVFLISGSYAQLIELFPSGGGGYLVATHLLGESAGLVSGAALLIDYVLTISTSCAAGVAALCSFFGEVSPSRQLLYALVSVVALVLLNLRGVRESIQVLLPIFLVFLLSHVGILLFGVFRHAAAFPELVTQTARETSSTWSLLGAWGTLMLLLRAFSLGGGTYTGIEAVSNGLQILREPRVRTGKRTMAYMAISLSFMAGGLILCYLLANVRKEEGATLNAALYQILLRELFGTGGVSAAVRVRAPRLGGRSPLRRRAVELPRGPARPREHGARLLGAAPLQPALRAARDAERRHPHGGGRDRDARVRGRVDPRPRPHVLDQRLPDVHALAARDVRALVEGAEGRPARGCAASR